LLAGGHRACHLGLRHSPNTGATHELGSIEGNWRQLKGKARQQWGKLTDDEFERIAGKRDELVGHVQEAYGISKDEADRQVRDWETQL